jgi:hypothetical protein
MNRAVPVMEVGPPGSPCRRRAQTAVVSCWLRAGVRSDYGKGPLPVGQVGDEKTNVCEPLLTHRQKPMMASKPGLACGLGTKACRFGSPLARELPVCGPGGARCKGGVSLSQALVWNRRTCRLDTEDQSKWVWSAPWSSRGRTPGGLGRVGESTDARHRGGPARSSDEGPVMGFERRGWAGQVVHQSTFRGRN